MSFPFEDKENGDQRWEWSNGGDHSEPWPPKTSTAGVMCYNSGEPGWYERGERETTSVCVGTREGHSGDCGRRAQSWRCYLSRQGRNDSDNPIRKINNKYIHARTHTHTHTRAQGTLSLSKNCTSRESVSPLSRLIRGFRNKYH